MTIIIYMKFFIEIFSYMYIVIDHENLGKSRVVFSKILVVVSILDCMSWIR
jgi:hypothetical protein